MIEPILARRSIRTYTDKPVTVDEITRLLEAGMAGAGVRSVSGQLLSMNHFMTDDGCEQSRGCKKSLADLNRAVQVCFRNFNKVWIVLGLTIAV